MLAAPPGGDAGGGAQPGDKFTAEGYKQVSGLTLRSETYQCTRGCTSVNWYTNLTHLYNQTTTVSCLIGHCTVPALIGHKMEIDLHCVALKSPSQKPSTSTQRKAATQLGMTDVACSKIMVDDYQQI